MTDPEQERIMPSSTRVTSNIDRSLGTFLSDGGQEFATMFEHEPQPEHIHAMWEKKAAENIEEWGLQDVETLLLAMQEELGELTQGYLEAHHEDGDADRVGAELDDLVALCIQLRWRMIVDD